MSCLNDTVGYFHDSCGGPIVGPFQFKFRGGQECEKRCGTLDRGFSQRKWETVNQTFTPHSVPQDFWESPIYLANIPPKKTKTGTPGEQSLQQQQTPLKTQTTNNIKQHNLLKPFAPPHQKKTNPLARNLFFLTSLSQMLPRLRREYLPTFILKKRPKGSDRGRWGRVINCIYMGRFCRWFVSCNFFFIPSKKTIDSYEWVVWDPGCFFTPNKWSIHWLLLWGVGEIVGFFHRQKELNTMSKATTKPCTGLAGKKNLWIKGCFNTPNWNTPRATFTKRLKRDFFHNWRTGDCRLGVRYRGVLKQPLIGRWKLLKPTQMGSHWHR